MAHFIEYMSVNWVHIAVGIISVAEVISLFVPGAQGTVAGIVAALSALPGVKDPKINQ